MCFGKVFHIIFSRFLKQREGLQSAGFLGRNFSPVSSFLKIESNLDTFASICCHLFLKKFRVLVATTCAYLCRIEAYTGLFENAWLFVFKCELDSCSSTGLIGKTTDYRNPALSHEPLILVMTRLEFLSDTFVSVVLGSILILSVSQVFVFKCDADLLKIYCTCGQKKTCKGTLWDYLVPCRVFCRKCLSRSSWSGFVM